MNIVEFLTNRDIHYTQLDHRPAFAAQRLAQAVHCSGEMVAKTVLLKVDDGFVLAVLPATHHIDLAQVQESLGASHVELATEKECGQLFSDCELGAMSPFGMHYGIRTILDESLTSEDELIFANGSHEAAIQMQVSDYLEQEDPIVAAFTHHL